MKLADLEHKALDIAVEVAVEIGYAKLKSEDQHILLAEVAVALLVMLCHGNECTPAEAKQIIGALAAETEKRFTKTAMLDGQIAKAVHIMAGGRVQ